MVHGRPVGGELSRWVGCRGAIVAFPVLGLHRLRACDSRWLVLLSSENVHLSCHIVPARIILGVSPLEAWIVLHIQFK